MKKIKIGVVISAMFLSLILLSPAVKISAAQGVDVTKIDVVGLDGATDIVYKGGRLKGVSKPGRNPVLGTYFSSEEDSLQLPNNGGSPVLDDKGRVVRFTVGNSGGYIMYIDKNSWKPYVSDLKIVKAGTKKAAVESLMEEGCSYYIDENYADDNGFLMIGYMRTEDESEAITDIIGIGQSENDSDNLWTADIKGYEKVSDDEIAGHTLFASRDSSVGNPICDLDAFGEASGITVTSKVLADLRLSRSDDKAKQFIISSDGYHSFIESDEKYIIEGVQTSDGMDIGISLASKKAGRKEKNKKKNEFLSTYFTVSSDDGESVDGEDVEDILDMGGEKTADTSDEESLGLTDGTEFDTQTDETYEDAPMTSDGMAEDVEDTEGTEGTILSVLGDTGATVFFMVVLGVAVVIPIVAIFVNKMLKKDKKEG